uniref:Serine active site containing 1 n=1 Tax=Cyprinus carpio TaxID=7962 RepID=A0A8C2DI37_CYPCA
MLIFIFFIYFLFFLSLGKIAKVTGAIVLGGCVFITYEVVTLNQAFTIDTSAILQEKHKSYIYLTHTTNRKQESLASGFTIKNRKKLHKAARKFLEISSRNSSSHLDADPHECALWMLLKKTRSADRAVRQEVQELAQNHHWQGERCQHTSYQTAAQVVDLARIPNVDLRFFLPPPPLPHTDDDISIEDGLRQLLASLPQSEVDQCVHFFTSLALRESSQSIASQWHHCTSFNQMYIHIKVPLCEINISIYLSIYIYFKEAHEWPDITCSSWLAADCPNLRILSVVYDTYLRDWKAKCPAENQRKSLAYRSQELLRKLKDAGVGDRPVVWVAHSMGGLLVKKMLLDASKDPDHSPLIKNTKGILFYSVPHHGMFMAEYSVNVQYLLFPSIEVKELCRGIVNKILIVPSQSAGLGIRDLIQVEVYHLNICKPEKKTNFSINVLYSLFGMLLEDRELSELPQSKTGLFPFHFLLRVRQLHFKSLC